MPCMICGALEEGEFELRGIQNGFRGEVRQGWSRPNMGMAYLMPGSISKLTISV